MAVGRSIFTKAVATGTTFTQARSRSAFSVVPRLVPEDSTIEIGTVTTLPAGSPATVTNVGTPSAAILDFGIPEGDQGDDGAVQSVVAGSNISVDNTDPANPVISSTSAVSSVNGQTGVVVLDAGDIGFTPAGSIAATDVQAAIAELDTEKQAADGDLTALAALSGTNTIYYRSASNTWTAVTIGGMLSFSAGTLNVGDAELTAIAGLTSAADRLPYFTGSGTAGLATFTSQARDLLDDSSFGAMLTTLGLSANGSSLVTAANYAAMRTLLDLEAGTDFYSIAAANAAFQPIDADLTSWAAVTRASGFDTFATTPSSANLAALVTNETGTGALVFANTPTLVTPVLGAATGTSLNLSGLTASSAVATDASKNLVSVTNTGTGNNVLAASPTLSGTPLSTTAAVDTNTTQIATTAFVIGQAGAATPLGNAPTAVVGTSTRFSRADHVHPGREVLTANRTYYVRTDGSDSNTGLVNNSGGAFLTIQKAYDVLANLDFNGKTVTIQIADGTYTAGMLLNSQWQGGGALNITGNTGTPANVIISTTSSHCFFISVPLQGIVTMSGMELRTTTSGQGILIDAAARVGFSAMRFGACAGSHILANKQSALAVPTAAYTISGGASWHWRTNGGGQIISGGGSYTVTVSGTPAFGVEFVRSAKNSGIEAAGITFSGAATGTRYLVNMNATIDTGGGGASFFPGNVAGSTATGGQYV